MAQQKQMSDAELRKWYQDHKAKQRSWGKRYRKRQQLLRDKAKAQGLKVTDSELDTALEE